MIARIVAVTSALYAKVPYERRDTSLRRGHATQQRRRLESSACIRRSLPVALTCSPLPPELTLRRVAALFAMFEDFSKTPRRRSTLVKRLEQVLVVV